VYEGELQDAVGAARTMGLGERLALNLLDRGRDRPTAVFCANNLLTQGVLRAVRRSGRRIPDDLAVVGFDDLPFFELVDPPLTVAAQPTDQLGRLVAEVLFERIFEPDRPVEAVVVDPEIQIRASCGPHPEHTTTPSRG
jgi:LacI family transcriptional regulator